MSKTIFDIIGESTPVPASLAQEIGLIRAAIAGRIFFYQQLKDGVCHASVKTLAEKLGLSTGAVSSNLTWLREHNYIKIIGEHKKGNRVNKYVVSEAFFSCVEKEHSADEKEHSLNESEHSADERNIQQMNGEEDLKEVFKERERENPKIAKIENHFLKHGIVPDPRLVKAWSFDIDRYDVKDIIYAYETAIAAEADNPVLFARTHLRKPKQTREEGSYNGHTNYKPAHQRKTAQEQEIDAEFDRLVAAKLAM